MKAKMLIAAFVAALAAGVAASSSVAVPDPGLKITPMHQLQFGTVPIGTMVIKPVVILNRTNEWMFYEGGPGAHWPNFDYRGPEFPQGFWEVDPSNPYGNTAPFNCWEIAPKGSCTLYFDWLPFVEGTHHAHFNIGYVGADSGDFYYSETITLIGTGY